MHGKIPQSFTKYHLAHYHQTGIRCSIKWWAAGLIEQLFLIVHVQWMLQSTIKHESESRGLQVTTEERNKLEDAISFELSNGRLDAPALSSTTAGSLFTMQGIDQYYWLASILETRGSKLPMSHNQHTPTLALQSQPTPRQQPSVLPAAYACLLLEYKLPSSDESSNSSSASLNISTSSEHDSDNLVGFMSPGPPQPITRPQHCLHPHTHTKQRQVRCRQH